jgi:hypothetical protein
LERINLFTCNKITIDGIEYFINNFSNLKYIYMPKNINIEQNKYPNIKFMY